MIIVYTIFYFLVFFTNFFLNFINLNNEEISSNNKNNSTSENEIFLFNNFQKKLFFKFKKHNYIINYFNKQALLVFFIKFKPSNLIKLYNFFSLNQININFLRKNKVFNKGRYSRNRQYYRTGVYWCIYINIIAVLGFYFWFFKLTLNFGYLWWILYFFFFLCVFAKTFNLFSYTFFFKDIFLSFFWFLNLLKTNFNVFFFLKTCFFFNYIF